MKICFFSGDISRSGGTERVATNIANLLCQDHDIYIYSIVQNRQKTFYDIDSKIQLASIFDKKNDIYTLNKISRHLKLAQNLREFVVSNEIEILIDIDTQLSVNSVPALSLLDIKHVAWEHFNVDFISHSSRETKVRELGRRLASSFCDAIVVLTERDQVKFRAKYSPKTKLAHIYNPIENSNSVKVEYDLNSKILLSAGRLVNEKGFDILVEVGRKIFNKHEDWKWVILGEGNDREYIQNKIEEYSLEKNIILKGNVTNISDYYQKASIFVLTSRYEGFGLVLTEAKAFSLPCVSFDIDSGPSEIILDDVNGFLVKPFDLEEMAKKINFLIENPSLRKQQSERSLKDTDKFDKNNIVKKWNELFYELTKV